jgi:DNA-directed RNA polymerase specialized sigma24 family protein
MPPSLPTEDPQQIGARLEALLAGDRGAAGWLYDSFAPGLHRRLSARYGGFPGCETDDLLQDAFLFYFQKNGKVLRDFLERTGPAERGAARLERHLWDLACGLASNRRRSAGRAGRLHSLDDPDAPLGEPAAAEASEEGQVERDLLERLRACLEGHGQRLALYFRLRFADGFSPQEVAALTGWSMKATYKLKQALEEGLAACARALGLAAEEK